MNQKAEVLRLKAEYLWKMNDSEGANQTYSVALNIFRELSQGWISWGYYCLKVTTKRAHDYANSVN